MSRRRLRTWEQRFVWAWAVLSLAAIYAQGQRFELDSHVTNRLQFHAIPMALSVIYHGRVHDYTAFASLAIPFQYPTPDVDTKIARAIASVPTADASTYYWAADDRGMGDYVIAAFRLFGPHSKSLYYFYFVVLGCSVLLYLADLGWHSVASAILLFVLGALYTCASVIPLGNLTLPIFEPGSLYEPRIIELLSYVATMHLTLASFFDQHWTPARRAIVAAQAAIFIACYHARSSIGWQVGFVLMSNVGCWIWRRELVRRDHGGPLRRSAIVGVGWPLVCVVGGLVMLTAYHRVAYNPRYFRDIGARVIWHNVLMGLSFNQHIRDTYALRVNDQAVVGALRTYLGSIKDPRLTPEWTDSTILGSFGGHAIFNWFTYENAARDLYLHIWRTNTRDMLHLYLVDKPKEIVRVLAKARRPDPDVPASIPQMAGLGFNPFVRGALLIVLPGLLIVCSSGTAGPPSAAAVLLLFVCSAVPGFLFYPVVHTMMGAFATVALAGYIILAQVLAVAVRIVGSLTGGPTPRVPISFAFLSRIGRSEALQMIGLALLTFFVAAYFAPRGFRGGFTDMAHDGYQLRQVLDLDRGGTIFKDTFDQYGPLSGYLNLVGYRMLGRNLLAVKYAVCLWYAVTAVLLYLLSRELLASALSVASVVAWLALAPFYRHGVMISPHAYVLFFQAAATVAIVRFARRDRLGWMAAAGICCGLCWALKTSMGVLFAIGVAMYFATWLSDGRSRALRATAALSTFVGAAMCVVALALAFLAWRGALHDWYLQTVVFPKEFYVDQVSVGNGVVASVKGFTRHFLELNFDMTRVPVALYWHLMRTVVVFGAIVLWRRRAVPAGLLITACLTPVLWLGAYPSANYMHQWWLLSLSFSSFLYCLQRSIAFAANRYGAGRLLRFETPLTVAAVVLLFSSGLVERWHHAWEKASTLREVFEAPRVIAGIRTDKDTLTAFRALYGAIQNFKQHHPSARIVSKDHCDGYTNCVPESLLWLSFVDDNTHDHPVYWPIPVLTTTIYPEYQSRFQNAVERTQPLIVDSWNGPFRPYNTVKGYQLLVGVRTELDYWYVFAPVHTSARQHGEVQVRIEPPPPAHEEVQVRREPPPPAHGEVQVRREPPPPAHEEVQVRREPPPPAHGVVQVRIEPPPPAHAVAVAMTAGTDGTVRNRDEIVLEGAMRDGVSLAADGDKSVPGRLYTWPADIDIPSLPSHLELVEAASAGRAKIVKLDRGRWIVRGSAAARFSYLLYFKERVVHAGEYFLATGRLEEGGVSIGLQRGDTWAGIVNVTEPGPFEVVLMPASGRYSLVVANDVTITRAQLIERYGRLPAFWKVVTGATLPTAFEIDRAGWASARR